MEEQSEQLNPQVNPSLLDRFKNYDRKKLIIAGALLIFLLLSPFLLILNSQKNKQVVEDKENPLVYPGAPYVPSEVIIKYRDSYTKEEIENLDAKLKEIGVVSQEKVFESDSPALRNYYLVKLGKDTDVKKALDEISRIPEIDKAEPNYIVNTQETPNDPEYSQQWDMNKINMPSAWVVAKGSSSVKVAVIDTGIDYNHPELTGRVINGKDFSTCNGYSLSGQCLNPKPRDNDSLDDFGHGTHVAGTVGAATNNGRGVAGVNWNISLMAVKAMGSSGQGQASDIAAAVDYATTNGANIINMSIGEPVPCSSAYQAVIGAAVAAGVTVVVAAGNGDARGQGIDASTVSPASCNGAIAVGATTANDSRATFSNYGAKVAIGAPGTNILSTWPGGTYQVKQGTSMAAPHVAGVAALLLSTKPGLSPSQVRNCLVSYADTIVTDHPIGKRLNALSTLNGCSGITPVSPIPTTGAPSVTPTSPVSNTNASIKTTVLVDDNQNGQPDSQDTGLPGAQVVIDGPTDITGTTNSQGIYTAAVTSGNYQVDININSQKAGSGWTFSLLSGQQMQLTLLVAPAFATIGPTDVVNPTPIVVEPTSVRSPTTPTPTPKKTYTCHERTGNESRDSIQMGSLVCEPNG